MSEKKLPIQDLGLLKLTKTSRLFVGLLPQKYQSLIVSYETNINPGFSDIYVSCVMPSVSHNVQVKFDVNQSHRNAQTFRAKFTAEKKLNKIQTLKHLAPPTLFKARYTDIPNYQPYYAGYYIHILNTKIKDKILAVPYLLPNVADDGGICFGKVSLPKDLLQANSSFWNSPFTNSMGGIYKSQEVKSNLDYVKRYKSLILKKQHFKDITKEICGNKFWSTSQRKADGVLITNCAELLTQIPDKYWCRKTDKTPILIALATLTENNRWVFTGKAFKFEMDANQVVTSQSTKQKLIQTIKKVQLAEKVYAKNI